MSDGAKIVELGPHENMSPLDALRVVEREVANGEISGVLIIAEGSDGDLVLRSSHLSREWALWMAMWAVDHIRGLHNGSE